ncbi:unnamed protein product [Didymodactylos carnosus]|uniref:Uncharacterized protein n=1 Tax=Didymodactylos carnosus TaxID=1234261 RepID=A0A814FGR8_9BILA|nr:unnamed protein product [Didymodactylos carnosus]CAF1124405.1 unnamed protein product [Didymodactylos carnosus]CAF3753702.1 unnamed protein product [Didymodactylos carnosus]CAF3900810.1 unnamed protein product [Didymodactylos carnosus]
MTSALVNTAATDQIKTIALAIGNVEQNLEGLIIVWPDADIHKEDYDVKRQFFFCQTINYLKAFDNIADCIQYVTSMKSEKICFIVSGKQIVPDIHS